MLTHFYDIESLRNVFSLCNFKPDKNCIDIYILADDLDFKCVPDFEQNLLKHIHDNNHNFNGTINVYDLHEPNANVHLAKTFGLSDSPLINDKRKKGRYPDEFRLVCDTDAEYDENKHPYLFGYNSNQYDTTELAMYLYEAFPFISVYDETTGTTRDELRIKPPTAKLMREYNDELFLPQFKSNMPSRLTQTYNPAKRTFSRPDYTDPRWRIRKNMLMTGRHLDVTRLNEKQMYVGLKRLLGMLGHQIKESDKLAIGCDTIESIDQLMDLIAYNVSDCVNLYELFNDGFYQGQFVLKKALLNRYPELIYEKQQHAYAPDIRPECVRKDRLFIDSSSAQLATKSLCPYGHLPDIPVVSFMYPSEQKAKELNIPRVNVLDEARKFFFSNFSQQHVRDEFDRIYNYYKSIEGKNFNESDNYRLDFEGSPEYKPPQSLKDLPKTDTCLFYYNADGTPSSCFVTFSTGGIHGAEYNKELYEYDIEQFNKEMALLNTVMTRYPDPTDLKKEKEIVIDGVTYPATRFLTTKSTNKAAFYKPLQDKKPVLFKDDKGATKLNSKYVFSSAEPANHEDFTSYYPNMLRMMSAFYNEGLGYDRYAEIFDDKEKQGKLMKDKSLPEETRKHYAVLREGTKLILNTASGAGDATFDSNIRMNNRIISMRIIGQLFSWRIGQAQTIHGARIISTNTDGLYSVLAPDINDLILEKESKSIGVAIEPEPLFLISKDSNNRIDINDETGEILSASGGTLACWRGPNPTKALSHPALLDWALAEYLIFVSLPNSRGLSLFSPFSNEAGRNIISKAMNMFEPRKFLRLAQNVLASSPGSMTYIFAANKENPTKPLTLQHYNRSFIMKENTQNTYNLSAATAKKIIPATIIKRKKEGMRPQVHDPVAVSILEQHGIDIASLPIDKEAVVKKITNIDEDWSILIQNQALVDLSNNDALRIMDNIETENYLKLLHDGFEKNWRNKKPGEEKEVKPRAKRKPKQKEETVAIVN